MDLELTYVVRQLSKRTSYFSRGKRMSLSQSLEFIFLKNEYFLRLVSFTYFSDILKEFG